MKGLAFPTCTMLAVSTCCLALITGCGNYDVPQFAEGAVAQQNRTAPAHAMPKELRAAYIASTQRAAPNAFAAKQLGEVVQLDNSPQQFVATIHSAGMDLVSDKDQYLQLHPVAVGCDGSMAAIAHGIPEARGNRVDVRRQELNESYLNGPLGVEQIFVLPTPPKCSGPKIVDMVFNGNLTAQIEDSDSDGHGDAVQFVDSDGNEAFSFTDLFVMDAWGKSVPAWFSVDRQHIALVVDDAAAIYPLTIDPLIWVQSAKLESGSGDTLDAFGASVAISGDTAVVGAPHLDGFMNMLPGSVYVFVRNGATWTEQAKLMASDAAPTDYFGASVSLDGDTLLVGACCKSLDLLGSAYVFVRNGTTWTEQQKLLPDDANAENGFGGDLAVFKDTALVGASYAYVGTNRAQGAAYVFERNGLVWNLTQKLLADDGMNYERFGTAVALSSDTAIVGAPQNPSDSPEGAGIWSRGAAYVFVRNGLQWDLQQQLVASDPGLDEQFGAAVAISGDAAFVGASGDKNAQNEPRGAVYVFMRNGAFWSETQKFSPSEASTNYFGAEISLSPDMALVGASEAGSGFPTAHIYLREGTKWFNKQLLVEKDGILNSLGVALAISGNTAFYGLSGKAVYVYDVDMTDYPACAISSECTSGFCIDGMCCDSACGNSDPNDCMACSIAAGGSMDGTCTPVKLDWECRPTMGVCDVPEVCDGMTLECPPDAKQSIDKMCRPEVICDFAERCDGVSNDCPADKKKPDGMDCFAGICSHGKCVNFDNGTGGGAATTGGNSDSPNDSGCACHTASTRSTPTPTFMLSLLGLALAVRRRCGGAAPGSRQ